MRFIRDIFPIIYNTDWRLPTIMTEAYKPDLWTSELNDVLYKAVIDRAFDFSLIALDIRDYIIMSGQDRDFELYTNDQCRLQWTKIHALREAVLCLSVSCRQWRAPRKSSTSLRPHRWKSPLCPFPPRSRPPTSPRTNLSPLRARSSSPRVSPHDL